MNTRLKLHLTSALVALSLPQLALSQETANTPNIAVIMSQESTETGSNAQVSPIQLAQANTEVAPPPAPPAAPFTQELFNGQIRSYLLENPEVIIEALQVLKTREAARETTSDLALIASNADDLFRDGLGSQMVGNPDGSRTLVEFVDYQCGYCKRAHATTTEMLANDPELRIIYKEFPILGPASVTGAKLLMAASRDLGPEYYEPLADALFNARGALAADTLETSLLTPSLSDEDRATLMTFLTDGFDAIQSDPEIDAALQANARLAQAMSISGTPGFIGPSGIIRGAADAARLSAISEALE